MGGALGAAAPLCEAGVVCVVCPRAALAKTAKTKAVPIRMIGLLLVVSLPPSGGGPPPVHKNEPRPTPGLLQSVICYLTLPLLAAVLSAAAATAEGSAKAITASPNTKAFLPPPKS
jgi:hypothetical protein